MSHKKQDSRDAEKRFKKARKSGPDRGRRLQNELDRIDALLDKDRKRLRELEKLERGDPLGVDLLDSTFEKRNLSNAEKARIQNTRNEIFNKISRGKVKNRALVDELSRQGLNRRGGTGTTLLGSQAKAPSVATTGTTLLRTA
jgi:hypothetical protein